MKKHIYLIILGITLFGVGLIVLVYQLTSFNIVTASLTKKTNVLTYNDNYDYRVSCDYCKVRYVYDENVSNTEIRIKYPSNYYSYVIEEENGKNRKNIDINIENISTRNIYDLVISDLKNRNFRNYFNQFLMEVEVVTNSN